MPIVNSKDEMFAKYYCLAVSTRSQSLKNKFPLKNGTLHRLTSTAAAVFVRIIAKMIAF